MKTLLAVVLSLILTTSPAWADISSMASFDLSTLTISGVGYTISPQWLQHDDNVMNVDYYTMNYGTLPPGTVSQDVQNFFSHERVDQITTASLAGVGTAQSISAHDALSASNTVTGIGFYQSAVEWNQFITPTTSGTLTVSIGYSIGQFNLPAPTGTTGQFSEPQALTSFSHDQLILTTNAGLFDVAHAIMVATPGTHEEHGTLTVTQQVQAGTINYLGLRADVQTSNPHSVPLPGMLWPTTFLGLAGLGWLWWREWRMGA